jgi:hypothetical protein
VSITLAATLSLAVAGIAPAAAAAPTRTVFHPEGFSTLPGEVCSFGVTAMPDERARITVQQFADGRTVTHGRGSPTLTNQATSTSLVHTSRAHITDTVLETGEILEEISGQLVVGFFEGDQGPDGPVGAGGALVSINGHARLTYDPDTFVVTSFEMNGTTTDLCALLA